MLELLIFIISSITIISYFRKGDVLIDKEFINNGSLNIAIWDTTTVDLFNPPLVRNLYCKAIYYVAGTKNAPDPTVVKRYTDVDEVHLYSFKTHQKTSLQLNLILCAYKVKLRYGTNCNLHVFTKSEQLKLKFQIQAKAYGITNIKFYGS